MTDRQKAFVEEYLKDMNAAAAYRRAGYKASSDQIASANAARLIANESIRAEIDKAIQDRSVRTGVTQDMVIEGLLKEARLDGEGSSHSARVTAWTQLGKHLKLFTEKHEHTGKDGGPLETRLQIVEEIVDAGTDEDDPPAPDTASLSPQ